ncbi:hypothetical protein H310_00780 [Aphanomyces invadans]|uniref:ABC transmembrane type-1 domain-containing protein n=1 Tax=Aphanomyces invadans TaxID=157072 RepID=A0A024UXS7_9STRA|nr:hypothetical protein H310_00780 [Aphanomyces invadans]ETW10488.1 hypothetical protein H310_00780 [Aphanomyces invadans]|eukprot:XP_008861899.1 hypothetical protein H310_00780 [Aphanomyces invadans]
MPRTRYESLKLDCTRPSDDKHSRWHPTVQAGWLSRTFFTWASPLLALGNQRQLQPDDLWPLEPANQCHHVSSQFEPAFEKARRSILWTIVATYGWRFALAGLLQLGAVGGTLLGPWVLREILAAVESPDEFDAVAIGQRIVLLLVVKVVQAVITAHANLDNQVVAVRITSALQHLLFQKAIALDTKCRRDKTAGEIANLFSNDITWILNFSVFANQLWLIPVQVIATTVMLYNVIGWATFVGFGVIVVTLVGNNFLAAIQHGAFKLLMECKDDRMKCVDQVFGAMQIIKMNAWEDKVGDKLAAKRNAELATLWRIFTLASASTAVLYLGPVLVTIVSFATYTLVMQQSLSATKMFTALTLFNLLRFPLSGLPTIVASMMQALVAVRRFAEFLDLDEKDPTNITTRTTATPAEAAIFNAQNVEIAITKARFGWDAAKPLFTDVNLTVQRGEFVVVHGSVGEGKSSLCAALLGEMDKYEGTVFVGGRPYDRVKYANVLEACALTKDLALFAAGDRTEIGQKGVNLSGGQKARISLARACYSDADIFILDSPLSAVDAIVQNEIFTKCFLGLLRHKTIVLVTHSPEIIASKFIDRTIEIKDGQLLGRMVNRRAPAALPRGMIPLAMHRLYGKGDVADTKLPSSDVPTYNAMASTSYLEPPRSPFPVGFESLASPIFDEYHVQHFDEYSPRTGRLLHDEERQHGRVATQVFCDYLHAVGGWPVLMSWVGLLTVWQCLMVAGDFWLSSWSASAATMSGPEFLHTAAYYLAVYSALSLGSVVMTIFRTLSIYTAGVRASQRLFDAMTRALLRAPMRIFDTTPIGRILNRYSNDINTIDTTIPFGISGLISAIFTSLFVLGTTFYVHENVDADGI